MKFFRISDTNYFNVNNECEDSKDFAITIGDLILLYGKDKTTCVGFLKSVTQDIIELDFKPEKGTTELVVIKMVDFIERIASNEELVEKHKQFTNDNVAESIKSNPNNEVLVEKVKEQQAIIKGLTMAIKAIVSGDEDEG